jgi:hypothetical protein
MNRNFGISQVALVALAAFGFLALCVADSGALAQNANSSTTMDASRTVVNMNRAVKRRGSRLGTRVKGPKAANADMLMGAPDAAQGDAMSADPLGAQDASGGQPADLSGTYAGRLMMTGGHDMAGQATLTITGNQFTVEGEGMNHTGRVYGVTTRGYTSAAFYFSELPDSTTNTPVVATVRARKSGTRLTLTPVPGARTRMTFTGRRS